MESEDMAGRPSSISGDSSENNDFLKSELEPGEIAAEQESTSVADTLVHNQGDVRNEDGHFPKETEVEMDLVDSPVRQVNIVVADSVIVSDNLSRFGITVNAQNGYLDRQDENHKHCGSVSGVKRARITDDRKQPSVHVTFNSLTRASKQKLEELLLQWSEWHAKRGSSSQDSNEVLESGEETYFPALSVGMEKSSSVSFWIENQTMKEMSSDLPPASASVPLYDRGFAFGLTSEDAPSNAEGGLEIVGEAARCFNCGSYSHSLRECPKPRDIAAVNQARKQHKVKKNQNAASRNATRYYQDSSEGKYGLKPGSLDAETRRVLDLGELDPPPWLNRMRELGYPPGYLDTEDEDQPSGITIFADEEVTAEQQDSETVKKRTNPTRKMTVKFPGVNAPIPENADEKAWATGSSISDPSRKRPLNRSDHTISESIGRRHPRASWDSIDDGPPGVSSIFSPPSTYPPRYGNYDSAPSFARSYSGGGWRSPLVYDDLATRSSSNRSSPWSNDNDRWRPQDENDRSEHEANEWTYDGFDRRKSWHYSQYNSMP